MRHSEALTNLLGNCRVGVNNALKDDAIQLRVDPGMMFPEMPDPGDQDVNGFFTLGPSGCVGQFDSGSGG